MLTSMREKSGGIVAKIFIGLLAFSFAIWGVSDILRVKPEDTLVAAGETSISVQTFSNRFRNAMQNVSRAAGRTISQEEARQMGLDRQVLLQLVREAVLKEEARRLNLSLSDDFIARRIKSMPQFAGPDGRFDPQRLRQLLFSANLTEEQFLNEERGLLLGNGVLQAVVSGIGAPRTLLQQVYAWRNRARDAAYVEIVADEAKLPRPDEATLKKFYQDNISRFTAPERRVISVLALTPDAVREQVQVSEDELQRLFEARRRQLETAEKRTIEQLRFDTVEQARQALRALNNGERTWEQLLREHGLKPRDARLGPYEKKQFPDTALADAVFSAAQGAFAGPVETPLGVFIARVVQVQPARTVRFDEVKEKLRRELQLEKARDIIAELYDRVEEARASGQPLAEAAKGVGLKLVETPPVALDGSGTDGRPVRVPGGERVIGEAFRSTPGADNDVVELGDDGFAWFDVVKVIPAGPIPFDKARDQVLAAWKARALAAELRRRAEAMRQKLQSGATLQQLAAEIGGTVKRIENLKRNDARPDFPPLAVRALFSARPGEVAVAIAPDGRKAWVMRVSERPLAPLDENGNEAKALKTVLAQGIAQDTGAQFIAALQQALDVKINMRLWRQASGAEQ